MKKICVILFAAVICCVFVQIAPAMAGKGFPTSLAGFTLGEDLSKYSDCCDPSELIPVSDTPFLSEVLIHPDYLPGVRGGSLSFGNCENKDALVRIKLKFHERGKGLFEKLLARYEKRFGEPDRYVGDAFKNIIAWEWLFRNGEGEQVSLVLMWSREMRMRPGVSIKMTHLSLMDQEYHRYMDMDDRKNGSGKKSRITSLDKYIPR